ncbi:hypothetical protein WJX73_008057 [Symbiochloris irregularis]|uniref:Sulfite exporter TauE/SafE n=1 Tax=Symbiochloris irregularis TaxID=706552 RepID=A0AAW1PMQ3_9CHLO
MAQRLLLTVLSVLIAQAPNASVHGFPVLPESTSLYSSGDVFEELSGRRLGPHKALFPLDKRDILAASFAAVALFVAAGGGIGGGGVLVPTFILLLQFPIGTAVALSNVTIVGGAISNFAFNIGRKHPFLSRPLIDWDLILVMEPATILGALVGGFLNRICPNWSLTACLALVLAFMGYKLLARGVSAWHDESAKQEHEDDRDESTPLLQEDGQASEQASPTLGQSQPLTVTGAARGSKPSLQRNSMHGSPLAYSHVSLTQADAQARWPSLRRDSAQARSSSPAQQVAGGGKGDKGPELELLAMPQVPWAHLSVLVALFLGVIASDLGKSYVPCGSWKYWLAVLAVVPPTLAVTAGIRHYLVAQNRRLQGQLHLEELDGQVEWNESTTIVYPLICSLAGLVAGLFGVGGGIVKGPLMLEMGVLPDVASATAATMILFTAASASVVFLSFGGIPVDYAVAVFVLGLVVTLAGQTACWWLVQRLGRRSIIIFAMAGLMLMSFGFICYTGTLSTLKAVHEDTLWHFSNICGSRSG